MQGKLLTATIALVLVCSVVGCSKSTADKPNGVESTTRSALEKNGVHDANGDSQNGQVDRDGDWIVTPDINQRVTEPNSLGEQARLAGEKVTDGIKDAGRAAAQATERATQNAGNAITDGARDVTRNVNDALTDTNKQ